MHDGAAPAFSAPKKLDGDDRAIAEEQATEVSLP